MDHAAIPELEPRQLWATCETVNVRLGAPDLKQGVSAVLCSVYLFHHWDMPKTIRRWSMLLMFGNDMGLQRLQPSKNAIRALRGLRRNMTNSTEDKIKGTLHEVKGSIKEEAGKVTNNPKLEDKGKVEHAAGKVQHKIGEAKEAVEELKK